MTQTTALAAAQTAATSSDITVAAGAVVTVALFTDRADGVIPTAGLEYWLYLDTVSADNKIVDLGKCKGYSTAISSPGTYRVKRPDISAYGVNVGVDTES